MGIEVNVAARSDLVVTTELLNDIMDVLIRHKAINPETLMCTDGSPLKVNAISLDMSYPDIIDQDTEETITFLTEVNIAGFDLDNNSVNIVTHCREDQTVEHKITTGSDVEVLLKYFEIEGEVFDAMLTFENWVVDRLPNHLQNDYRAVLQYRGYKAHFDFYGTIDGVEGPIHTQELPPADYPALSGVIRKPALTVVK